MDVGLALCAVASATAVLVCLKLGKAPLFYSTVSRDEEPVAYWIGIGVLAALFILSVVALVGLAVVKADTWPWCHSGPC